MMFKRARLFTWLFGLVLVASFVLHSQEITGNISGTVTDPTGSVIPGATVIATNTGTGVARTTQTTSAGVFFLNNLPVGNYRLSVESTGFKKYETTGIRLDVNDRLNFAVKMEIGALSRSGGSFRGCGATADRDRRGFQFDRRSADAGYALERARIQPARGSGAGGGLGERARRWWHWAG
jgi:hypothetical protein